MAKKDNTPADIQTRNNEVRFITSDPKEMHGKYLAAPLYRGWAEDFIDEDTGETVTIERSEFIEQRAKLIDADLLARIQFHLQAGDIKEVEVSNQCREAYMTLSGSLWPWSVTAMISGKKRRFLLYAASAHTALDITKDYIELNFAGNFHFINVKTFDWCMFIKDAIRKDPDEFDNTIEREFYKIEVEVLCEDSTTLYTFVLQTKDVDTGVIVINNWIANKLKEDRRRQKLDEDIAFTTTVKSGVIIPCYRIIEQEFSEAHMKPVE